MEKFKIITDKNFEEFSSDLYENWLVDRVHTFLLGNIADKSISIEESLINCESPIEQLLSIELESLNLIDINLYNPYIDIIAIEKQKEIIAKGNKYRADFLIPVVYKNQENICFIIECDGYEFHQKTKKQVENDNKRSRDLQEEGYEIIRFSGTEIYHKPRQCAENIKNIILSKCKYIKDE